jgi:hypothetical protein
MSKTLDNVVKNARKAGLTAAGLGALVFGGGAVLNSGCEPQTAAGMVLSGNAYRTHDPYAANVVGNSLMRSGEAREGRSQVNVYNGNGQQGDPSIVYPTSRDNGIAMPGTYKATPAVRIDSKTGKKSVRTTGEYGTKYVEVGENDILDDEKFIHADEDGRKRVYKKLKNDAMIVEQYRFVKFLDNENSESKPREEPKEKPQTNSGSQGVF